MLVVYPAFYHSSYILPRHPEVWFRSSKLLDSTLSCGLVSSFISLYPRMSGDPKQPHSMPGGYVISCPLTLLYLWGHFGSLEELSEPPDCQSKY